MSEPAFVHYPSQSNTCGRSYSYHIPGTYNGTATRSYSQYIQSKEYNACANGSIDPPVPVSLKSATFRYLKPHAMPEDMEPKFRPMQFKSDYASIAQPPVTLYGLESAPATCLGYNNLVGGDGCSHWPRAGPPPPMNFMR